MRGDNLGRRPLLGLGALACIALRIARAEGVLLRGLIALLRLTALRRLTGLLRLILLSQCRSNGQGGRHRQGGPA
jgi:hypothetical protein